MTVRILSVARFSAFYLSAIIRQKQLREKRELIISSKFTGLAEKKIFNPSVPKDWGGFSEWKSYRRRRHFWFQMRNSPLLIYSRSIPFYIGARSAENFQNISSTFLKKLLTNGRAQRGKFLKLFMDFLMKFFV